MNKIHCYNITQFYIQGSYFSHRHGRFSQVFILSFSVNACERVGPLKQSQNLHIHTYRVSPYVPQFFFAQFSIKYIQNLILNLIKELILQFSTFYTDTIFQSLE